MAGRGPAPKPTNQRRRRNVTPGTRTLGVVEPAEAPDIPFEVLPLTQQWWDDIWQSPMSAEFDKSDLHGLWMLAKFVDLFWRAESSTGAKDLLTEIRLQRACFGLTPLDRSRLKWELERGASADEAGEKRRTTTTPAKRKSKAADPRLKIV